MMILNKVGDVCSWFPAEKTRMFSLVASPIDQQPFRSNTCGQIDSPAFASLGNAGLDLRHSCSFVLFPKQCGCEPLEIRAGQCSSSHCSSLCSTDTANISYRPKDSLVLPEDRSIIAAHLSTHSLLSTIDIRWNIPVQSNWHSDQYGPSVPFVVFRATFACSDSVRLRSSARICAADWTHTRSSRSTSVSSTSSHEWFVELDQSIPHQWLFPIVHSSQC